MEFVRTSNRCTLCTLSACFLLFPCLLFSACLCLSSLDLCLLSIDLRVFLSVSFLISLSLSISASDFLDFCLLLCFRQLHSQFVCFPKSETYPPLCLFPLLFCSRFQGIYFTLIPLLYICFSPFNFHYFQFQDSLLLRPYCFFFPER